MNYIEVQGAELNGRPLVTNARVYNLGNAVRGVGNRYTEWAAKWGSASATIRQGTIPFLKSFLQ